MKKLTYIILFLVFGTACEMVVDVDVPRDPDKLVVNSLFEVNQPWNVKVHKSSYILDEPDNWAVANATVKIYQGDEFIQELTYQPDFQRYYSETNLPMAGKTYKIEVSASGYEAVSASCKTNIAIPLKSAKFVNQDVNLDGMLYDEIEISFDDFLGESYYEVSVLNLYYSYTYDESGQLYITDSSFYPMVLNHADPSFEQDENNLQNLYATDFLGDNKEYKLRILVNKFDDSGGLSPIYYIKMNHVSSEYYKYIRSLNNAAWNTGNPFSEPVIVFNNIQNGFGIFAGYSSSLRKVDPK